MNLQNLLGGRYRVLQKLHGGAMSNVLSGVDEVTGGKVIFKCVGEEEPGIRKESLLNEIEILSGLQHKGIPQIYDVFYEEREIVAVMEYKEGISLNEYISRKAYGKKEDIRRILIELCDILNYIHGQNRPIIHRDIKPENIIIGKSTALIDFGAARRYAADARQDTVCLGTLGYAAPEQFGGIGQSDVRTDIYGFGMTMKRLLVHTGRNYKKLRMVAEKCVREQPDKRYQSVGELMAALYGIKSEFISITLIHTTEVIEKENVKKL